ncbi:tRNA synthetases class I (M)-domain-containing protein [Spinellus fusiger]|nr:tRNA synthetases class I (M)-domain-containing protein [Spinellus fusiger]
MAKINITLPKLTPATKPFIHALKVVLATHAVGASLDIRAGDAVELLDERIIVDANAAARHIFNTGPFDTTNPLCLLQDAAIEREEAVIAPLLAKKKVAEALSAVERTMTHYTRLFTKEGPLGLVDVIYFGALYEVLKSNTDKDKYSAIYAWYDAVSKTKAVVEAVSIVMAQLSNKSAKKAFVPKTKSVEKEPLPERNTTTQKIKQGLSMKKTEPNEEILPVQGKRNIMITSALPYANNIPHLGNIVGSTLSADVYARYCRARGYNTLYICGTDEYGTATETKALEDGVTCQELCDKYHAIHRDVYKWFEISFDFFGRTTTPQQTEIVQDVFKKALANGFMYEQSMTQLYCEHCQRFLADRYVEGICPSCKYIDARGDQCDGCGMLINAPDLIDPRCKLDGNKPVMRDSSHFFLDLQRLQGDVEKFFEQSSTEGKWSPNGISITQSWLKEGLKPRCMTRDLKWGVPVPLPGYEGKVFYVWFDAPIGYPSITANYTKHWEQWCKNPENVKMYQFMGKDNVPFHSVVYPAAQIASGDNWTKVNHISTTEYLNYEGGKFSKSRNLGVFGNNAEDSGIPPSVWRYYLLSSRPETGDSMFTWSELITKNNSELLNNLGNFVNRAIKFVLAKYDGVLPEMAVSDKEEALFKDVNTLLSQYNEQLENVKIRNALATAMAISARGNQYLQDSGLSNATFTGQRSKCDTVLNVAINLIFLLSAVLFPYMPSVSETICLQINAPLRSIPDEFTCDILPGHKLSGSTYLFTQIDEKMEAQWKQKYGSSA